MAIEFLGSVHVRDVGLRGAADQRRWEYASAHGFAIVSKDTDFRDRSHVEGFPPKIIWLDVGHAGTAAIADLLRGEHHQQDGGTTDPQGVRDGVIGEPIGGVARWFLIVKLFQRHYA